MEKWHKGLVASCPGLQIQAGLLAGCPKVVHGAAGLPQPGLPGHALQPRAASVNILARQSDQKPRIHALTSRFGHALTNYVIFCIL